MSEPFGTIDPSLARTQVKRPEFVQQPMRSRRPHPACALLALVPLGFLLLTFQRPSYQPWVFSGPAPAPLTSAASMPQMEGAWVGTFGTRYEPAMLTVIHQYGSAFVGELVSRTDHGSFRIAVQGSLQPPTAPGAEWVVRMVEVQTLDRPFMSLWSLGADEAVFSSDGLHVQGAGSDTSGQHYGWNLQHVSTEPVISQD